MPLRSHENDSHTVVLQRLHSCVPHFDQPASPYSNPSLQRSCGQKDVRDCALLQLSEVVDGQDFE